jgi:hypothetical protein
MCAAELFRQRPNFSVDLAEIICQKLATLAGIVNVDQLINSVLLVLGSNSYEKISVMHILNNLFNDFSLQNRHVESARLNKAS